jgi:Rne/Rng family ribonuclease
MKKTILISEADNIAALLENDRVCEFFVNRGELLLGDVYTATVENILPGIDAAFVNLGKDKMGFLHANDVPGTGSLKEKLVPKQKLLVQITKEPTGHKGPRVSTAVSLPGRFLVLVPEERGISISRRIAEARERARLKSVVNLMKPPGVGIIIRTEAKGQGEQELFEDFELLWDRWQTIVSDGEASIGPTLIYRDQDLLFRVIRDAYSTDVAEIIVDTADGQKRALDYMQGWASRNTKVLAHMSEEPMLIARGIDHEIEAALSDRAELPSGGHLNIQPTEALTVIDVNSGRFTSSRTQAETVRRTNLEAAQEIPRQLRLRNIGGMVIVDFIDMDSRRDQQQVLEQFQRALEDDRAKPQIGQLSDLGLVELTRRRQGQSLRELFTAHCTGCSGLGVTPTLELGYGEYRRMLSFKQKDEDAGRGRRGRGRQQQSGGVLKAVTASGGRIKPIVEHEHEHEDDVDTHVSEEILNQVPDEILEHQHAFGKSAHIDLDEEGEEGDRDAHFGEEQREKAYTRAPLYRDDSRRFEREASRRRDQKDDFEDEPAHKPSSRHHDEEDDEHKPEDAHASFAHTAHLVGHHDEPADFHDVPHHQDAEHKGVYGSGGREPAIPEEEPYEVEPPKMPETPFETEIDPVTGIYRLKVRPNQASMNSSMDAGTAGTAMATAEHPAGDWHHSQEESAQASETESTQQSDWWTKKENESGQDEE